MRNKDTGCGYSRTFLPSTFPSDRRTFLRQKSNPLKQKTQLRFRRWVAFEQLTGSDLAH
jgi:hypothetical protein